MCATGMCVAATCALAHTKAWRTIVMCVTLTAVSRRAPVGSAPRLFYPWGTTSTCATDVWITYSRFPSSASKLQSLGIVIPNSLGIHRVLQSLPPSYKNFVMNYNMQNMDKMLLEFFSMLKSAEVEIKKEHQVLLVNKTTKFKKGKSKQKGNFK